MALESIPREMADAVRPLLAGVDRAGYARYLEAMVHYTRASGERLRHAAERVPDGPLRELFSRLAGEESGHHLLAEADLAALSAELGSTPPARVVGFHDRWMASTDAGAWLGALYALESVGEHLRAAAVERLSELGLARDQVRFVMVHLDVDEDHGARVAEACASWTDTASLLEAARAAGEFWVGLHVDAFRG